ncbi:flagellar motor switch phosphatase FliY [uncultured Tyzzerella sp.]|uniref:flagellar motor switch phosphatase FliY n=1 Tax=uncultured Tyzzerella sp. TaxID=2321398 RepID=UPI0029428621|nr:flagellar motor switch phosphatase FliY [uncultured Tyzzerella sp.]
MSDMLSQEEINALLGDSVATNEGNNSSLGEILTDANRDILGEVGNISMGTAATTLSALLNHKVEISTPTVSMVNPKELSSKYDKPCVGLKINYKVGLIGSNLLILKQEDVKIIANLMMGGDGKVSLDDEGLTDLDLSAISEAMNQMVGSSSTSLSSMLGYKIDIDTPQAFILTFDDDTFFEEISFLDESLVCNSFRMVVQDLIDSEIMQLLPIPFAESIIEKLTVNEAQQLEQKEPVPQPAPAPAPAPVQQSVKQAPQPAPQPAPQMVMPQTTQSSNIIHDNVNVQPAQFQSFDMNELAQQKENITIIRDVPLEVTVELGRTRKPIKEILEFNPGTIIELDKLAGEPIDILVNGKFIAKGEVVVIDENFGVRVTDIISTEERI